VIEIVSAERCIGCDRCVQVCPTDVFDPGSDGVPVVARLADCQTCFLCEAYCPVDALFVAPQRDPLPAGHQLTSQAGLPELIGSYRAQIGWGHGRVAGATIAVGPALRDESAGHRPSGPPLV
jgi:NAD-dependent dihydropyrimidine dehydrogenase PreA subunit